MTQRVPIIDGLRGAAIVLVLFYHVYEKTHFAFRIGLWGRTLDAHTFIQAGFLGVELFFFVSGFCLMLPYAAAMLGKRPVQSWKEYASRRFWKIVPSYYLSLALIVAFYPFDAHTGITRAGDVLLHVFFVHSFNDASFASLNGNYWSLAVEVQFYFLFPLLVWGFFRSPVIATTATTAVGLLYANWIAAVGHDNYFIWSYDLLSFLPLFALGAFCAYVYERWIHGAVLSRAVQREMGFVAIFMIAALGFVFEQLNRLGGGYIAWVWQNAHRFEIGLILSALTLSAACATPRFQRWFANPVLRFYSDISYNMYLWNAAIVSIIGTYWWGDEGLKGLVFAALSLGSTTLVGLLLTRLFERPLMRYRFSAPSRAYAWIKGIRVNSRTSVTPLPDSD